MNLLAVIMISDHVKDKELDKKIKKFNPLESNAWNAKSMLTQLEKEIQSVPCPEMDDIITLDEAKAIYWEPYEF